MRKASFKVVNANANSSLHNSRTNAPKYLIEDEKFKDNYYEQIHTDEEFLKLSELKYLSKNKQRMQERQKVALVKETVLNLEEHHTSKDVKKLFKKLNKEYGGHYITELSIHRDEGHFEKDGIAYYPTKHILKKNDDWYIVPLDKFLDKNFKPTKKDFSQKVDISEFKKVKNIHAHVKFSMFDLDTGLTGRMTKGQVSKRLKFVAKELKLAYKPEQKISSGKAIKTIKDEHDLRRRTQIQELYLKQENNQLQERNNLLQYNFREYQKRITAIENADKEQKKELHRLNTSVKKKEATVTELESKISKLEANHKTKIDNVIEKFKEIAPESESISEAVEYVKELRKENAALKNQEPKIIEKEVPVIKEVEKIKYIEKEKIKYVENPETEKQLIEARETILEQETSISTLKDDLSSYKQSMNDLEAENKAYKDSEDKFTEKAKKHVRKELNLEISNKDTKKEVTAGGVFLYLVSKVKDLTQKLSKALSKNEELQKEVEQYKPYFDKAWKEQFGKAAEQKAELKKIIEKNPEHFKSSNITREDLQKATEMNKTKEQGYDLSL